MRKNLFNKVYDLVRKIPKGKVTTYGQIAKELGIKDARIVGWALHVNRDSKNIPCHRVVNKEGKISSSYAFGGEVEQKRKLESERIVFVNSNHIDTMFIISSWV